VRRISYLLSLAVFFAAPQIFAQAALYEVREFYTGSRALAMGGAGIATVNDETALLVNPAGLGKLRDSYGTILDPEVELSSNVAGIMLKTPIANPFEPFGVVNAMTANPEAYYHAKLQLFPSYVVRNFGIGLYGNYLMNAKLDSAATNLSTYYRSDLALLLGYNFRLWGGRIKFGFVGKAVNRIEINKDLPTTGDLTVKGNASEGVGLGGDVGLTLAAPWVWLPTLSAVARNVGGMKYESGSGLRMTTTDRPMREDQDIDVAVAVFPIHSNRSRSSFTIEYKKMNEASRAKDKLRYTHVGYEFNYGDVIFLRAGIHQKYWTGGIEFATQYLQFQLASYGEEVAADGGAEESRRVMFKLAFRF